MKLFKNSYTAKIFTTISFIAFISMFTACSNSKESAITTEQTTEPVTASSVIDNTTDNSSKTVYIGTTGTKYHTASCRTLRGNGVPIYLEDAIAQGRTACKVCNP